MPKSSVTGLVPERSGPPAAAWENYKAIIIDLYERKPLKELQKVMASRYGFVASKRMYDRRFKRWDISKYIKKAEKDELLELVSLSETQFSTLPASTQAKLRRYQRDISRGSIGKRKTTKMQPRKGTSPVADQSIPDSNNFTPSSTSSYDMILDVLDVPACGTQNASSDPRSKAKDTSIKDTRPPDLSGALSPYMAQVDTVSGIRTASVAAVQDRSSTQEVNNDSSMFGDAQPSISTTQSVLAKWHSTAARPTTTEMIDKTIGSRSYSEVPRLVSMDPTSFNMEHILLSIKYLCSVLLSETSERPSLSSPSVCKLSPVTKKSWSHLSSCIYLCKLNDTQRGFPGLDEFCSLPPSAVIDESLALILKLATTIAPLNTSRYPVVRTYILRGLYRMAESALGKFHPVTIICAQLLRDGNDQTVSRTLLGCLEHLTSHHDKHFQLDIQLAVIAMLRREGDLDAAIHRSESALASSSSSFGSRSIEHRKAQSALVHIYMTTGSHLRALDLCRQVIGPPASDLAFTIQDRRSVEAIEDLAEIHKQLGQFQLSSHWLSAAADLAVKLLGPSSIDTKHIVDKLLDMTRMAGMVVELEQYQKAYGQHCE